MRQNDRDPGTGSVPGSRKPIETDRHQTTRPAVTP